MSGGLQTYIEQASNPLNFVDSEEPQQHVALDDDQVYQEQSRGEEGGCSSRGEEGANEQEDIPNYQDESLEIEKMADPEATHQTARSTFGAEEESKEDPFLIVQSQQ